LSFSLSAAQRRAEEGGPQLSILCFAKGQRIELRELMNDPGKLKDRGESRNENAKSLLFQQQGKRCCRERGHVAQALPGVIKLIIHNENQEEIKGFRTKGPTYP